MPSNLRQLISQLPSKEIPILDHMKDLVARFVEKGLLQFSYVHQILYEYCQELEGKELYIKDILVQLIDAGLKLMPTKAGSKVMCYITTWSGARERKKLLKNLKGHALESVNHPSAHLAVIRLIEVTDDTIAVQKMLLEEVNMTTMPVKYAANGEILPSFPPLYLMAIHTFGRKLLLRLLQLKKSFLEPDEEPLFIIKEGDDGEQEMQGSSRAVCKKSRAMKRREHLTFLKSSLLMVCGRYFEKLARNRNGHKVLEEVIQAYYPSTLLKAFVNVLTYKSTDDGAEYERGGGEVEEEAEEDDEEGQHEEANGDDEEEEMNEDLEEKEEKEGDKEQEDFEAAEEEEEVNEAPAIVGNLESEQLPIEEDSCVHSVLKFVLSLQTQLEDKKLTSEVDKSLWEDENSFPFASSLLDALLEEGEKGEEETTCLLDRWILSNRGCFALVEMMKVPSCQANLREALIVRKASLVDQEHAGGRKLSGML